MPTRRETRRADTAHFITQQYKSVKVSGVSILYSSTPAAAAMLRCCCCNQGVQRTVLKNETHVPCCTAAVCCCCTKPKQTERVQQQQQQQPCSCSYPCMMWLVTVSAAVTPIPGETRNTDRGIRSLVQHVFVCVRRVRVRARAALFCIFVPKTPSQSIRRIHTYV